MACWIGRHDLSRPTLTARGRGVRQQLPAVYSLPMFAGRLNPADLELCRRLGLIGSWRWR